MLAGLGDGQTIITGAFTLGPGSACPVLAALRAGGPERAVYSGFPDAWDAFCRARRGRLAKPAEVAWLAGLLRARIMPEEERDVARERCGGCGRELRLDYHGACAACGTSAIPAPPSVSEPCGVSAAVSLSNA